MSIDSPPVLLSAVSVSNTFDHDNSKALNPREFQRLCFSRGYALIDTDLQLAFKTFNLNANGEIEQREFSSWWENSDRWNQLNLNYEDLERSKAVANVFNLHDPGKTGIIRRHDFDQFYSELINCQLTAQNKERALRDLDRNGDGKIVFSEYIHWLNCQGSLRLNLKIVHPDGTSPNSDRDSSVLEYDTERGMPVEIDSLSIVSVDTQSDDHFQSHIGQTNEPLNPPADSINDIGSNRTKNIRCCENLIHKVFSYCTESVKLLFINPLMWTHKPDKNQNDDYRQYFLYKVLILLQRKQMLWLIQGIGWSWMIIGSISAGLIEETGLIGYSIGIGQIMIFAGLVIHLWLKASKIELMSIDQTTENMAEKTKLLKPFSQFALLGSYLLIIFYIFSAIMNGNGIAIPRHHSRGFWIVAMFMLYAYGFLPIILLTIYSWKVYLIHSNAKELELYIHSKLGCACEDVCTKHQAKMRRNEQLKKRASDSNNQAMQDTNISSSDQRSPSLNPPPLPLKYPSFSEQPIPSPRVLMGVRHSVIGQHSESAAERVGKSAEDQHDLSIGFVNRYNLAIAQAEKMNNEWMWINGIAVCAILFALGAWIISLIKNVNIFPSSNADRVWFPVLTFVALSILLTLAYINDCYLKLATIPHLVIVNSSAVRKIPLHFANDLAQFMILHPIELKLLTVPITQTLVMNYALTAIAALLGQFIQ